MKYTSNIREFIECRNFDRHVHHVIDDDDNRVFNAVLLYTRDSESKTTRWEYEREIMDEELITKINSIRANTSDEYDGPNDTESIGIRIMADTECTVALRLVYDGLEYYFMLYYVDSSIDELSETVMILRVDKQAIIIDSENSVEMGEGYEFDDCCIVYVTWN